MADEYHGKHTIPMERVATLDDLEGREPPPPKTHVLAFSQPRCQCEFPMIKYGGKTVACDHCGLPPGRAPAPSTREEPHA